MKKLFGGVGGGGGATKLGGGSQQLSSSSNAPIPSSSQQSTDRDYRGLSINIEGMTVMIDSKLAEGGFSIVFLVKHVHPRQNAGRLYALKRQFVNEPALLEACKREIEITKTLGVRHPNIITYVASSLSLVPNSDGNVYEYLLLTQYYRGSVLRLMNERLTIAQWLSTEEILRIFTDVCAAVARLHHCQTPVIHRDLKVENLLLDEEGRCVLCDFGSATTRTLSTKTHTRTLVEDEIARFTTLSYRAPEMIDLYAGHAITTKVDIWALGVMLYKLCYFALPFGESALGIQNAAFSFPTEPTHFPPELLGLIVYMLTPEIERRPDIYQVSVVAYRLRNCQCPVKNLNNVTAPDSAFLLRLLREHGTQKYGSAISNSTSAERALKTPNNDTPSSIGPISSTTSVAPRQRPKPRRGQSPAGTPTMDPPAVGAAIAPATTPIIATVPPHVIQRLIEQSPSSPGAVSTPPMVTDSSMVIPAAMSRSVTRDEISTTDGGTHPQEFEMSTRPQTGTQHQQYQQHRRNASDPSAALLDSSHLSAFKPYKSQQNVPTEAPADLSTASASWNPFDLDDHSFGLSFDALPRQRKDSNTSTVNVKSRESLISDAPTSSSANDNLDPFGAAPFRPRPQPPPKPANAAAIMGQRKKNSLTDTTTTTSTADETTSRTKILPLQQGTSSAIAAASSLKLKKGYKKLIEDGGGLLGAGESSKKAVLPLPPSSSNASSSRVRRRSGGGGGGDNDSVGSASDLQARMQASGSSTGDEEDERLGGGSNNKIGTAVESKLGAGLHHHHRHRNRHHRSAARRTTSSDDNEEEDEDDDDGNRSSDEGESAPEASGGGMQRFDPTDDEDLEKVKTTLLLSGGSKLTTPSGQGTSGDLLIDEGGIEGSYLEQEIIGRQPLLADDDDEEQQQGHHQASSAQHLGSMIVNSGKGGGSGSSGSSTVAKSSSSAVESVELSVMGIGGTTTKYSPMTASTVTTSGGDSADIFHQAPFSPSSQQEAGFRLSTSNTSTNHQRTPHYQSQQRPVAAAGATAAFVNTSFQGE